MRYVFGVMGMLGVMVAYMMRACLSIAITQMVKPEPLHKSGHSVPAEDVCPGSDNVVTSHPFLHNVRTEYLSAKMYKYGKISRLILSHRTLVNSNGVKVPKERFCRRFISDTS